MLAMKAPSESVPDRVEAAIRPLLESEGFDLILVEHVAASAILRLFVDKLDPTGPRDGIGIDDCTQVSRLVSDLLDAEGITDTMEGAFKLEVSSPGLDRPLVRPRDFRRFVGSTARVTARREVMEQLDGRRRFKGVLRRAAEADEGGIEIEVDEQLFEIGYRMIEEARLVPEF